MKLSFPFLEYLSLKSIKLKHLFQQGVALGACLAPGSEGHVFLIDDPLFMGPTIGGHYPLGTWEGNRNLPSAGAPRYIWTNYDIIYSLASMI